MIDCKNAWSEEFHNKLYFNFEFANFIGIYMYLIHQRSRSHRPRCLRPKGLRSKVCCRSPAEMVGSNPTRDMGVCLLWVLCVVRLRSLRRADHSGVESRLGGGRDFPHPSRPARGPPNLLYNEYRVFPGGKNARTWR